jgi:PLP dependent protein
LIVVTKTHPVADVHRLARLGIVDVAENRSADLVAKAAECADLSLRWHFVGQLQRNKAAAVATAAGAVHSVDRSPLATALSRAVEVSGRDPLPVLLQVSLDGAMGRGGCPPGLLRELADEVAGMPGLHLQGVMAVAPLAADPDRAFARLRELTDPIRADHPAATWISAGMSGDLEAAIRHGATHVRVGAAILGARPTV